VNRILAAAALALALCAPVAAVLALAAPAQAWMLTAVVKADDGKPSVLGYGFGDDRQACIAAMNTIKKMQPEAAIVQPCVPEGASQQAQANGCNFPAADGHMHRPDTDGCPFIPRRGW
jgi:hypothetical protein